MFSGFTAVDLVVVMNLQHQSTSQHPAEGGPTEPSVDELKVIISRLVERVTTNAKDLGDLVENATTPGSPATSHEFSQIQCLSTTVQDDFQKLRGLQAEYEHLVNANGSSDVDPLLMDLYVVLSDVDAVLAFSKAFLETSASALHPEGAHDPAIGADTVAARGQAVSGEHESTARVGSGTRLRLGSTVLSTSTDSDARVQVSVDLHSALSRIASFLLLMRSNSGA
ncbi:unnamed protein product [Dibothriocephalus latus]|uniref:Uncharacterized protein n=1 Tax=Dibothriocephalus latus TaxID=60516 RepID=A0A3P7LKT3_DIBLA|nr:unnamed protein product [Dibothriocephalus latus]